MVKTAAIAVMIAVVVAELDPLATPAAADERRQDRPAFEQVHSLAFGAAGRSLWLGADAGLFRSEDGGTTWTKVSLPVTHGAPDIMAVTTDPRDARVLYIGTHEAGVLKTTDGGRTWGEVNTGLGAHDIRGLAIDPNAPAKLHALVRDKGVYRTTNGGQTWRAVDAGPRGQASVLTSVNLATGMGGIYIYAVTPAGLQRNQDCF